MNRPDAPNFFYRMDLETGGSVCESNVFACCKQRVLLIPQLHKRLKSLTSASAITRFCTRWPRKPAYSIVGFGVESRRGAVTVASRWRLAGLSPRRLIPV